MKTPIAITLIIVGALIVLAPTISDYFYQQALVEMMKHGANNASLDSRMGDLTRLVCWVMGGTMIFRVADNCLSSSSKKSEEFTPSGSSVKVGK